jgi:hypothetical protein
MSKLFLALICVVLVCGCGQQSTSQPEKAEIVPVEPLPDHYYSMKDGLEYGYEPAVSEDAQKAGQLASTLLMFKFAGERDGVYQIYTKDGYSTTVAECSNPCDFIKIMVFAKDVGHVKTERMRATEGTIVWLAISDAINNKLEQFVNEKNGKKFTVWWDEKKGLQTTHL